MPAPLEHFPEHVRRIVRDAADEFRKGNHRGAKIILGDLKAEDDPHIKKALASLLKDVDRFTEEAKKKKFASGEHIAEHLGDVLAGYYLLHRGKEEEDVRAIRHALEHLEGTFAHQNVVSDARKLHSLLALRESIQKEIEEIKRRIREHGT